MPLIVEAALKAADPSRLVRDAVSRKGKRLRIAGRVYSLDRFSSVWIVGAGKGAARMAAALEEILGNRLAGGVVVTQYGYRERTSKVKVLEAGHPVPDAAGVAGAKEIERLLSKTEPSDLVLIVISGGGSALLPAPAPGISLRDKRIVTERLLRSGAAISEINVVRKHLSRIKGGGLLRLTRARVVSLILSDVVGDRLDAVASGPTVADPSSYADAIKILRGHRLWSACPIGVRRHFLRGERGKAAETVKPGEPPLKRARNVLIGSNRVVISASARAASRFGFEPVVLTENLTGEAREAAEVFGTLAHEIAALRAPFWSPVCFLAGGETTVTVRGRGMGGRCQEFVLAGVLPIEGLSGTTLAAFSTDGADGPPPGRNPPAAGAFADGKTAARARGRRIDLRRMLDRNDAYTFFQKVGGLIRTGPTRTHLNDLYLLMIERPE